MSTVQYGKANYESGGSFEKQVFYQLGHKEQKDRVQVLRLAPPIKALAEKGVWAKYIKTHWGYSIRFIAKSGEVKRIPKTFLCIERADRDGTIIQECPECKLTRALRKEVEEQDRNFKNEGKTPEEIDSLLRSKKGYLKDHNLDRKWHVFAKNLDGKWGFLKISHTCKQFLDAQIKKLLERGVDPLSPEKGVYFRFERTGGPAWSSIKDIVEVHRDADDKIKFDQLTDADWGQLDKLPELHTLGQPLTYDQIQQLVQSGGDEETVRLVMNLPQRSQEPDTVTGEPVEEPAADVDSGMDQKASAGPTAVPETSKAPEPPPAPTPVPEPAQAAPSAEDQEIAKLQALLAEKLAKKTAPPVAKAAPTPAKTVTPDLKATLDLPMDEFLRQFEK